VVLGAVVAAGIAGGIFFSIGDIATKVATQGGARIGFVLLLILGYTLGTVLLQLGYQAGEALTVAGLATLLTNALPIAAGTIVLAEPVPSGAFGALRVQPVARNIQSGSHGPRRVRRRQSDSVSSWRSWLAVVTTTREDQQTNASRHLHRVDRRRHRRHAAAASFPSDSWLDPLRGRAVGLQLTSVGEQRNLHRASAFRTARSS
jgi:hypothetical protein